MNKTCPDCRRPYRKPLRPADAVGAAAYMQFCPHCLRELVYGAGIKVRIGLIVAILVAYLAGLFDVGSPVLGLVLRVAAGAALLGAWFFLPTHVAGPRRYNEETGMADEVSPD